MLRERLEAASAVQLCLSVHSQEEIVMGVVCVPAANVNALLTGSVLQDSQKAAADSPQPTSTAL